MTETKINLAFKGLSIKNLTLDEFHSVNVPEGLTAEITTQELEVKVRGPVQLIQRLTADDLRATVDFTGAEAGSYSFKVTITFGEEFAALGVVEQCSVYATVSPAE